MGEGRGGGAIPEMTIIFLVILSEAKDLRVKRAVGTGGTYVVVPSPPVVPICKLNDD